MLKVSGPGSITTCDGITRRDFLAGGTWALVSRSPTSAALQSLGAVERGNDEKSAILIFNLGARANWTPGHETDAPREIADVPADPDQ